jgi:hypothetical protein
MWFNSRHLKHLPVKSLNGLHGYVLPHAGTSYTGHILNHTLRFRPTKKFTNILIIYSPSHEKENVKYKSKHYYHEFFVVFKTLQYFFKGFSLHSNNKKIIGYNVRDTSSLPTITHLNKDNTLYVVSADFSHHLPLQIAIEKENCAAHSIMHRYFTLECSKVIDNVNSFKALYNIVPPDISSLQWVGRTRSPGRDGVGYLSFLIRERPTYGELKHSYRKPDGFFVTAYDNQMRQRECLGNTHMWNVKKERDMIKDVIHKANTTSRLTGGKYIGIPITHYTVTYLFKDFGKHRNRTRKLSHITTHGAKKFIRGWHAIMKNALYLPDVFLEHTFNNGVWIKPYDTEWPQDNVFKLKDTLKQLSIKSSRYTRRSYKKQGRNYTLFFSEVKHVEL